MKPPFEEARPYSTRDFHIKPSDCRGVAFPAFCDEVRAGVRIVPCTCGSARSTYHLSGCLRTKTGGNLSALAWTSLGLQLAAQVAPDLSEDPQLEDMSFPRS